MNKQRCFGLLFLLVCSITLLHAQKTKSKVMEDYNSLWNKVTKFEQDQQPKSALTIIEQIESKAAKEKNTEQQIKALIKKASSMNTIDADNRTSIIPQFESLLSSTKSIKDKAIINSMLGSIYMMQYYYNSWEINQRTKLVDYIPENMDEWSSNIFFEKSLAHFKASLEDKDALLKLSADEYKELITPGKDSRTLSPTLYDFLMLRAISTSKGIKLYDDKKELAKIGVSANEMLQTDVFLKTNLGDKLPTLTFYQEYQNNLNSRKMEDSFIFQELDRIAYLNTLGVSSVYDALVNLEKKYDSNDVSVEIINAIINNIDQTYTWQDENSDKLDLKYNWIQKGLKEHPKYKRISILKNALLSMEFPTATLNAKTVYHPEDKEKKMTLRFRNLTNADITVRDEKGNAVHSFNILLKSEKSYTTQDTTFLLNFDKIGNYTIEAKYDKKANSRDTNPKFSISKLAGFSRAVTDKQAEFYVVDNLNGTPIKNAVITIYEAEKWKENTRKLIKEIITNEMGIALYESDSIITTYNNRKDYSYQIAYQNDTPNIFSSLPTFYTFRSGNKNIDRESTQIFLDRDIYRPGQTVYFKAILSRQIGNEASLLTGHGCTAALYNANRQLISELDLKTNDFGSVSGQFILPRTGINGNYYISINNNDYYFSVEEYKRPTFQVTFDKNEETYTFGDKVTLKGHAENFSGVKLQNASVAYSIDKQRLFWWNYSSEFMKEGVVTTDGDGAFTITFTIPEKEKTQGYSRYFGANIYSYVVTANVTDLNGETQTGTTNVVVGDVSMVLSVNIDEQINKDTDKAIVISATNLAGSPIETKGTFEISRVEKQDTTFVATNNFVTGIQTELLKRINKLASGSYIITLKANDDKGREVRVEKAFVVYSFSDKYPPIESNDWFIDKKVTFSETQPAEIIIGVSSQTTVLYDIIKDNKVLNRELLKLNNANKLLSIPYKKEYGDDVTLSLTYVVDGKAYERTQLIRKESEVKQLNLRFETFRDKLRPGQKEEWRIIVNDIKGKPAVAEMLASMYDSSLDKIKQSQSWYFNPIILSGDYVQRFSQGMAFSDISLSSYFTASDYENVYHWYFDDLEILRDLNLAGSRYGNGSLKIRGVSSIKQQAPEMDEVMVEAADLSGAVAPMAKAKDSRETANIRDNKETNESQPQIRQNFNETAFFYPHLKTNEKGETIISFTVPESNTSWKFRALTYDKALNIGTFEAIAVSRKELMVIPNMPRFVRQGDKTAISTKIANMSETNITGDVKIELFDPITEKPLDINVVNQSQQFSVEKDGSTSVQWLFDIPENIELIGCRIVAKNETFSDGEQHVLSVLPNRILVTESMTMNVRGNESKNFTFDKLADSKSNSLSNYKLTFEYAANPAWYAIQALPVISNPTNENAVNWFASYYANTLGSFIVDKYPKVNAIIKAWKQNGGNTETLVSKLEKNEELKAVLLEETPWVLEAKNESEQMERLSLLFDINNTEQQTSLALEKLAELQASNGGWAWYKDMMPNRVITQYILYGLSSLTELNAVEYRDNVKTMQISALNYIDGIIKSDFDNLKKYNVSWRNIKTISTNQLEYLYVRSAYRDIPISKESRDAERFYTSVVEKYWTKLNLYEKSLLLVLAKRNGNKELAKKLITSLREYSSTNDEMGMYWANNRNSSFGSNSATTVHTFIMSAFKEMDAPSNEMDLLKQWLLKQKQTQLWESTHATVDAINALLSTGSDWFSGEENVKITIDGNNVDTSKSEAGTGYLKEVWTANEITPGMANVSVEKLGNSPSYGALYWQYYEDLDKITQHQAQLSVDKKLFVENTTADGKSLVEITKENALNVGDKVIVRLTVRADRDFDFVQLKDMRASCFEPTQAISGVQWKNGGIYYQTSKDASTNFFFDFLAKGTYVFEYPVYVNREGEYSNGITSIQCMYAPEFTSHTGGERVTVK